MFKFVNAENLDDSHATLKANPAEMYLFSDRTNSYCGLWYDKVPPVENARPGLIGQFATDNDDDAIAMLHAACDYLNQQGCDLVIGPMDGNTWKPYRFVTWQGSEPPFLLEPQNPANYPEIWQAAGFESYHKYCSTITDELDVINPKVERCRERLIKHGISWRSISQENFEADLRSVYQLSLDAFSNNVLYTPLEESSFINQYLPFAQQIDPDFVFIAMNPDGSCCGFVFAIPDFSQLQRGEQLTRVITKTLAVSKDRRSAGLGTLLVDLVKKNALAKGLKQEIHALMHSDNVSTNINRKARLLREYTLYKREI